MSCVLILVIISLARLTFCQTTLYANPGDDLIDLITFEPDDNLTIYLNPGVYLLRKSIDFQKNSLEIIALNEATLSCIGAFAALAFNLNGITITNCTGNENGGAIYASFAKTGFISNCNITKNKGVTGGAIYLEYGEYFISNTVISNNNANQGSSVGGGIFAVGSRITIRESEIRFNSADDSGGGLWLQDCISSIYSSLFVGNYAPRASAIFVDRFSTNSIIFISDTIFESNDCPQISNVLAPLTFLDSNATIDSSSFTNNICEGAIRASSTTRNSIVITNTSIATSIGFSIGNNRCASYILGAVSLDNMDYLFDNVSILGNNFLLPHSGSTVKLENGSAGIIRRTNFFSNANPTIKLDNSDLKLFCTFFSLDSFISCISRANIEYDDGSFQNISNNFDNTCVFTRSSIMGCDPSLELTSSIVTSLGITSPSLTSSTTSSSLTSSEVTSFISTSLSLISPTSNEARDGLKLSIVIASSGAAFLLLIAAVSIIAIIALRRRKRRNQALNSERGSSEPLDLDVYLPVHIKPETKRIPSSNREARESWRLDYSELEIGPEIGRGAFGVVYKASWRRITVAVKQVAQSVRKESKQEFLSEAALMKKLRPHKNVIQLYGVTTDPLSLITEYAEKGSLLKYLQSRQEIPVETRDKIILGIAKGMLHLHIESIVHRDLAARNVLLSELYEPKISDFGFSREQPTNDPGVTQTTVGPLKWLPPEWISSRLYSFKSDVWSFAVVLVEILTRKPPYPNLDGLGVAMRVAARQLSPEIPEGCPDKIAQLITQCSNFDPADRPDFKTICDSLGDQ